jgi:hypothetical protein
MTDRSDAGRRWRVTWGAPSTEQPGMSADADGLTSLWVASDDPDAIKAFVAAQHWAHDAIIELSVEDGSGGRPPRVSVHCRPVHVARWLPTEERLPEADPEARPPRSRSQERLALLQAMRRGVDDAVAAGALLAEDGAGLMLLAQDALDRQERLRGKD